MAKAAAIQVPERLQALSAFITQSIVDAAVRRVIFKEKFFNGSKLIVKLEPHEAKIALLIVRELNPYEDLQDEEEALLRGINSDTLRNRRKDSGFRPL